MFISVISPKTSTAFYWTLIGFSAPLFSLYLYSFKQFHQNLHCILLNITCCFLAPLFSIYHSFMLFHPKLALHFTVEIAPRIPQHFIGGITYVLGPTFLQLYFNLSFIYAFSSTTFIAFYCRNYSPFSPRFIHLCYFTQNFHCVLLQKLPRYFGPFSPSSVMLFHQKHFHCILLETLPRS